MDYYNADPDDNDDFIYEEVRDPADAYEWLDAVLTEIAWQTSRTLFIDQQTVLTFQAMLNLGYSPVQAATELIKRYNLAAV